MQSEEPKRTRRILLLAANPKGTSALRLDEERKRIKDSLKRSHQRDQFDIHTEFAVTIQDIRQALLEYKPEVVIFCGHGAGSDGIVCEDELGNIKLISTVALRNLFELVSDYVKCVLLNACFAEIQANEIVKHIDFVIGMKHSISDEAASSFSVGFCDALFRGEGFADCFKWGVISIQLDNIPQDSEPILRVRQPVEKTLVAHCKKSSAEFAKSPADGQATPAYSQNGPASGIPDAALGVPTEKYPWLRWMPRKAYLGLLVPVVFLVVFIASTRQNDITGIYIQENYQKSINVAGKTSEHVRRDEVSTTLSVSLNPRTGKWRVIETTIWKYYYAFDLNDLDKRSFIGMSKAEVEHEEYGKLGGKIQMFGSPGKGQVWLQVEPRLGDQKQIDEINAAVILESDYLQKYFTLGVWTEWSVDQSGNLTKEKWYRDELEGKEQGRPGKKENFLRQ